MPARACWQFLEFVQFATIDNRYYQFVNWLFLCFVPDEYYEFQNVFDKFLSISFNIGFWAE